MAFEKKTTVTIVNRNYPPLAGITGDSAAELARFLISKLVIVRVIHIKSRYDGANPTNLPFGDVFRINTFFNGKSKLFRLFVSLIEGYLLVRKAKSLNSDVTIFMTDPPLLNFWAAILLNRKHKWFLWSMDLYPEAFVSGNLISKESLIYKLIDRSIIKNPPNYIIGLGEFQVRFLTRKYQLPKLESTILPCGIYDPANLDYTNHKKPEWSKTTKIILGYCGNLGEAHSLEFLMSIIDFLDPAKFVLIIAVYGSKSKELLEYAKGKVGISIEQNVLRQDLGLIDIHLSTLDKAWVNVCVPSKTVSSVCAGSSFLYHGLEESDNWGLLKEAGWIVHDVNSIEKFLKEITRNMVDDKRKAAAKLSEKLNESQRQAFESIFLKLSSHR